MNARLKGKLTEKKISQKQIADVWHCNLSTACQKLNGNAPIQCEELVAAADAFGLSDAELLYILVGPRA